MNKINVAIVDDRKLVRKGIMAIVREFPRIGTIKEAGNGRELIQLIKSWKPQVILMDLEMPDMDGLDATKYIINHYEDVKVIGLTFHTEEKYILHMIELGAHGYLLKDAEPEEVEKAIYSVVDKDFYYNELIVQTMRNRVRHKMSKPYFYPEMEITAREKEILKYICQEKTNKEIAEKLFLSPRTVEKARSNLIDKVGVQSTVGLVKFAIERGYDL